MDPNQPWSAELAGTMDVRIKSVSKGLVYGAVLVCVVVQACLVALAAALAYLLLVGI